MGLRRPLNTRIFRIRSGLTRLAVRLATQPLAKRSRALAMSSLLLNTGMPTASTLVTGDFTNASTTSRS